ncbi:MAG: hypothetical protein IJ357_05355 [Oscillospiraceae bacterium]|nr:hypothetical protein [Oscillospiraceae bacterium]
MSYDETLAKAGRTPEEIEQVKALHMEYYEELFGYAYLLTGNAAAAQELLIDVFVKILFDPQPLLTAKRPLTWLKKAFSAKFSENQRN